MKKIRREPVDLSALSRLAPELAEMLAVVACDIALVLDDEGVIRSVALGGTCPAEESACAWVGQRWTDTVTGDTRDKAEAFLDDLASTGVSRLRHFAHASEAGSDIPVAYTAVRLGELGPTLAVGRDLRAVTAMQQRLVATQQAIEAGYWQRRHNETRQRLPSRATTEPVLLIDAATFDVIDASDPAARVLGRSVDRLIGQSATSAFSVPTRAAMVHMLETARDSGRAVQGRADIVDGLGAVDVIVAHREVEADGVLLMSLHARVTEPPAPDNSTAADGADFVYATLAKRTPDAIVVCDPQGTVTLANESFRHLIQWPPGHAIIGCQLSRWIGTEDAEGEGTLRSVLSRVRSDGSVGLLLTRLRRPQERWVDVELSATLIVGTDAVGFIMRVSHGQGNSGSASDQNADRNLH